MSEVSYRRLYPDGGTATAEELAASLAGADGGERPYVALNMVASIDGRIRVEGRSSALGGPGDRVLFHALRRATGAVMVGAGTARAEGYRRLVREPADAPQPVGCLVSGRLAFAAADVPLLEDPGSTVVILTAADRELEDAKATVSYVRSDGRVDLAAGLRALRAEHGVRSVLCEGGPTLNGTLLAAGLVDELFLTVSPLLVGGADPLGLAGGVPLPDPQRLELASAHEADGMLFLRYAIRA